MSETQKPRAGSRRLWSSALGIVAALILAVGVNLLADRAAPRARVDLTQNRLYTLSDGTRSVLAGLKDPVTLRLFYSRRLGAQVPVYGAYADRVRDMLAEYVALSGGQIRLERYDPEPFSETEDRALAYGLQGVPIDQSGEQVYFGLAATNLVDEERVIAFFQPDRERFLETDLTRLVWELSNPERPVIGVLSALPLNGDPRAFAMRAPQLAQPYQVMTQLRQFFTVRDVAADAALIDPEIGVLLVAQPPRLPAHTEYAIDQFVMRGGKLFVMVDPQSESQASRPGPTGQRVEETPSSLDRLLNAWGIEAPADQVVLDLRGAIRVRSGAQDRVQAVDYVAWWGAQAEGINRAESPLGQLELVNLASPGEVRKRDGAAIEFVPLLSSSPQSMLADVAWVRVDPNPARILGDFRADNTPRVIAARVRGELASAFPDGAPPLPEGVTAERPAHRAKTEGAANLIVANDSDILEDGRWVRVQDFFGQQLATPFASNGAFMLNLIETLGGSDALISLRGRGESLRPFTLVDSIRREADAQYRQTERQLTQRLEETEKRLRELRQGGGAPGADRGNVASVITPEQRAEIDAAREEILRTRRELRGVQLELRRDIEGLETWLRVFNIVAVPALLTALAIGIGVWRSRRRAAARA